MHLKSPRTQILFGSKISSVASVRADKKITDLAERNAQAGQNVGRVNMIAQARTFASSCYLSRTPSLLPVVAEVSLNPWSIAGNRWGVVQPVGHHTVNVDG